MTSGALGRIVAMSNASWTKSGRRAIEGRAASAEVIDLQAARLALLSGDARTPPRLDTVPLAFKEWRRELDRRSPPLRGAAWIAAAAAHGAVAAAIFLYAAVATLPDPLPVVAVTLTFESAPSPAPQPMAAVPVEASSEAPAVIAEPSNAAIAEPPVADTAESEAPPPA